MLFREKTRLSPGRGESGQSFLKSKREGLLLTVADTEQEGKKTGNITA